MLTQGALAPGQEYPYDRYFNSQWGLYNAEYPDADINAKEAWELFKGSNTVKVFITESGVLVNPITSEYKIATGHPDLENKCDYIWNWEDFAFVSADSVIAGHGTFVAGIVGAQTNNGIGIAAVDSGVRINCSGPLAGGINDATSRGAEIINMSWDDPNGANPDLISACASAYNHDILLLASMNNNLPPTGNIYYPAGLSGVMAVGATQITGEVSAFSEVGSHLSVVAPGGEDADSTIDLRNIHSTSCKLNIDTVYYYDQETHFTDMKYYWYYTPNYNWWAGTSFSTPLVTSTASLLKGYAKSKGITLNNDDIRRILELTASGNGVWINNRLGYGIINARKALDMLNPPYQLCKNSNTVDVDDLDGGIPAGYFEGYVPGIGIIYDGLRMEIRSK